MVAVPIKPEYGPTLGRLLSPRWRATSPLVRGLVRVAIVVLVVLLVGAFLTLENAHYSHGGSTPFKGQKGTIYEGGFRAPAMVRWPGHVPAGAVENGIISGLDWL